MNDKELKENMKIIYQGIYATPQKGSTADIISSILFWDGS